MTDQRSPLDPDPLYVDADELWDPAIGAWVPRPSVLWALLLGIVSGAAAGVVLGVFFAAQVLAASPGPAQPTRSTAAPAPEAPRPQPEVVRRLEPPAAEPIRPPAASPAPAAVRSGTASWYGARGLIAAAGPGLRHGDWRGSLVVVSSGGRSVTVRLSDWCQCYKGTSSERLIDLSDDAFARLAPLSRGLITVTVAGAGPTTTVPPTDEESLP